MIIQEEDYIKHTGKLGMHWGKRKSSVAKIIQKGALNASYNNKTMETFFILKNNARQYAKAERIASRINKLQDKKVKALNESEKFNHIVKANIKYMDYLKSKYASVNTEDISIGKAIVNNIKGSLNLKI